MPFWHISINLSKASPHSAKQAKKRQILSIFLEKVHYNKKFS
jgi:hypothetical protein